MEISFNRMFIVQLSLGIICIMTSCSSQTSPNQVQKPMDVVSISKQQEQHLEQIDLSKIISSRVSIISSEGLEIELDPELFNEQWIQFTSSIQEIVEEHFEPIYTLVIWDKLNQPHVLQVSHQGVKLGQQLFSGESMQFLTWIRLHMGEKYPSSLQMDRMTLEALDLSMKKQIPEKLVNDLFALIQDAVLVKGEIRIQAPLFPHYKIIIEDNGKEYIELDILSPTFISIQDGNDSWYYQLHDSIFSHLKKVIPITPYNQANVRYLFHASNVIIDQAVNLKEDTVTGNDPLRLEVAIHHLSRLLAEGTLSEIEPKQSTEPGKQIELEFFMEGQPTELVTIFEHHFIYDEGIYLLANVKDKVQEFMYEHMNVK